MTEGSPSILREAVEQALARGEVGVQVAIWGPDGLVGQAWGGMADATTGRPVDSSTVFPVYSVTKAITATAFNVQVDRGLLDPTARVIDYWPEYGAAGKEGTTISDILTHRAGMSGEMPTEASGDRLGDWDWVVGVLAASAPRFPPGQVNAYHSVTWGWLVGELVRRTDPQHRPFCQFVDEELFQPLGVTDCWMTLPPDADHRLARLTGTMRFPGRSRLDMDTANIAPEQWRVCAPSGGATMSAHGGARFFAALANGGKLDGTRLVSETRLLESLAPRIDALAPDAVAERVRYIGARGYWLGGAAPPAEPIVANGNRILWHPGAGGSIGWADLDQKVGVVICHNRLFDWEALSRAEHPFGVIADVVDKLAG
jgi:CubicO group peptidase (beta-lactamase class C family)